MPMTRIMVIVTELRDVSAAAAMTAQAIRSAGSPDGLRFAFSKRLERQFWEAYSVFPALARERVVFYGQRSDLAAAGALIKDESHFLVLMGAYAFQDKWDQTLLNRLSRAPEKNAVLTGCIGEADGEFPPQAYLPALGESFEDGGVLIQRGLPLVCSAAPPMTLVIDPALIFGRPDFLKQLTFRAESLSIAAYVSATPVYALDRAVLWPLHRLPERRLKRPEMGVVPAATLNRFEQLAGFRYEQKKAGVRTNWGLFTTEDSYRQQLPNRLALSQRRKAIFTRSRPGDMPLIVTAFIDLPNPRKPIPVYILRFEYLKALTNLPLYLYTGGGQERLLRASFPNAHSYPDNALLPRSLLRAGMTMEQWMQRNKLLLLDKTARQHPDYTHVAWVNADILKHPICPQAMPDFASMRDDRIHMATVNAVPDGSFLLVPVKRLRKLLDELSAITQMDEVMKRGFGEQPFYERLYQRHPDWFALHPMPQKHLLFLKAFDPSLLDERYQTLLRDEAPVCRAEPTIEKERKQ